MNSVDAAIVRVLNCQDESFVALAKVAGLRPEKDFRHANLSGVDFSNQDLAGFDFRGARLDDCRFTGAKIRRARFDKWVVRSSILDEAENEDRDVDVSLDEAYDNTFIYLVQQFGSCDLSVLPGRSTMLKFAPFRTLIKLSHQPDTDMYAVTKTLGQVAKKLVQRGNMVAAETFFRWSHEASLAVGLLHVERNAKNDVAWISAVVGRYEEAEALLLNLIDAAITDDNRSDYAMSVANLAKLLVVQGRVGEAVSRLNDLLALFGGALTSAVEKQLRSMGIGIPAAEIHSVTVDRKLITGLHNLGVVISNFAKYRSMRPWRIGEREPGTSVIDQQYFIIGISKTGRSRIG